MIAKNSDWIRLNIDRNAQFVGVRILSRASFVLIVVTASITNDADQSARAVGLISIRAEGLPMGLGTHPCMQPSADDVPDEPAPPEPPCPKSKR